MYVEENGFYLGNSMAVFLIESLSQVEQVISLTISGAIGSTLLVHSNERPYFCSFINTVAI